MKRRWKKFLAGVLSAALALNLAAPLALADGVACSVTSVFVYPGYVGPVNSENLNCIQGEVFYDHGLLTFHGDVTLTTVGPANLGTTPLVEAIGEKNLRLVANSKVVGYTKGNGIEGAKEIDGGEYDLTYADLGAYLDTKPKGILGGDTGTTITAGTTITLKDFHTGIGGGNVQIDGTVNITGAQFQGATYGIANSTTMNHGSELEIHADRYIGKDCLLTYNGGHLLINAAENADGNNIVQGRLSIGEGVSKFWYRTDENGAYTEINVKENYENFTAAIGQNQDYLELTDVDPDQPESETYDLWVAGKQVTETNQNDVLGDGGSVKFDPDTNTLTLSDAFLTPDGDANFTYWIDSDLTDMLTITGTATLSDADGIMTAGPLTLDNATLTLTGNNEDGGEEAIRAGRSDEDITIQNSKVTIAGTNAEGNFFNFGIRCGKLTVANSTLDVKVYGSAIEADELKASGAGTVITAETDSQNEEDYAIELNNENSLTMNDGLVLVEGEVNKSRKAKIAQPEQVPTDYMAYWVVRPGDKAEPSMQIPGAIFGSEEEARLFEGWFLEDGTRLEDSRYYMGPGADHVGNLDRNVTFYGHWRTAESGEGSPDGSDGSDGFGTLLAVGAVVGVAGVVAYQVGTELILDQLLPAGVAVPHTRAELAMLLWNTAGRPAPAALPAFADVADPELAQAAQWAIEQGYLKARADGSFKPDKGVAKWRVIRGYRAVTEP